MTGYLWAALGFLGGLGITALGDMVSEEVRDRLDHLPHAILHLAALRLDPVHRVTVYEDEWLPELTYILKETRPITRLIKGTHYALGILVSARRIVGCLHREAAAQALSFQTDRDLVGWAEQPGIAFLWTDQPTITLDDLRRLAPVQRPAIADWRRRFSEYPGNDGDDPEDNGEPAK